MLESGIGHRHHQLVGRLAVGFNNDRSVLAFGVVEQWSKAFE